MLPLGSPSIYSYGLPKICLRKKFNVFSVDSTMIEIRQDLTAF